MAEHIRKPFAIVTNKGHVIRADILEQYAAKTANTEDGSKQLDQFAGMYVGSEGTAGLVQPLYNPEALARVLELNPYHYRACKVKARDAAGLGYELVANKDNPSEQQKQDAEAFLNGIKPSLSVVLDRAQYDFEAIGYGLMETPRVKFDVKGPLQTIVHMPSHTMRAHVDGNRWCQIRNGKKRWFKRFGHDADVHQDTGQEAPLGTLDPIKARATEVVSLINYTSRSDYYGLSDVLPALGAIHGDVARRDYNIAFFDNYGVPAYAVFISGNFDPGDEDPVTRQTPLEKTIEDHFANIQANPHSTMILSIPTAGAGEGEVKIEMKPLSVEVKEASFRLYRKDNRDEVLSAHGVPPYRAGIAEEGSLGGTSAKESTEIYKQSIIEPRQEVLESIITMLLHDAFEITDWKFKLVRIDTTDEMHDADLQGKVFLMGGIMPIQIIRYWAKRFGSDVPKELEQHPALNAYYVHGQSITANLAMGPDIESALLGLQERLLEVAIKHVSTGDSNRDGAANRALFEILQGAKGGTRLATYRRDGVK